MTETEKMKIMKAIRDEGTRLAPYLDPLSIRKVAQRAGVEVDQVAEVVDALIEAGEAFRGPQYSADEFKLS